MANNLRKKDDFPTLTDFFPSLLDEDFSLLDKVPSSLTRSNFKADVHETDQKYELKIDLPGFDKENISIDYHHDVLTIQAKRQEEKSKKNDEGQFIKRERSYGSMTRQFYLTNVDEEKAKANYTDGVLTLIMPKLNSENTTKKQISIE
ncbi:Hsp20/alpha crystallin family protein [Carnobacterium sp. CS13]|uniref:Hsp20/alpha crystallin family protein n=1 Tax=Carnobacterium sp. CS13 TaxID=2800128 RepID=UPI0019147A79|nr:Hsp20/alpha crystallin family protein [Carnobacterium sp. CS13]QQP70384.1 Hsp20/alpha crystallin family protein [Carnobacterium sp. CS13]